MTSATGHIPTHAYEPMVSKVENVLRRDNRISELYRKGNRISILVRGTTSDPASGVGIPTKEYVADFWADKEVIGASELRKWVLEAYGKQNYNTVKELAQLLVMDISRHYGIEVCIVMASPGE
jgi:hypothetical protein